MIVVLMGVTGSGKTTVGALLAHRLGWPYFDADDFHPSTNVEKMRAGTPLTDDDRWPWLDRINASLQELAAHGESAVLGCSALKRIYRERLSRGLSDLRWVHLKGDFALIGARLRLRKGHYMNPALLGSQFAALEAPEDALTLDVQDTPERLAERIAAAFVAADR